MKQYGDIWLPDRDTHFISSAKKGKYQDRVFHTALKYMKGRDTFIDVGAHVGFFSLEAHREGFKEIISIEPDEENFECLNRNLEGKGSLLINEGVSCDHARLYSQKRDSKDNSGAISYIADYDGLPMCTLDDFSFPEIDRHRILIKIDVQGMEYEVIKGAESLIKQHRPVIIIECKHNGKWETKATDLLKEWGMVQLDKTGKDVIMGWKDAKDSSN